MNLLKSGSLGRCCSGAYWCTPSCRDTVKTSSLLSAQCDPNSHKLQQSSTKMCDSNSSKLCNGRKPHPALWTQIRFNKGFPRFHRDIEFPNFDGYRKDQFIDVRKTKWGQGDEKCGHTYATAFLGTCAVMYGAKTVLTHLISSMAAAADVLAMASIEIDLSKVAPGACISVKWRGKPLFIKNRTQADIDLEASTPLSVLKDPQSIEDRCIKPEWLVVIGICTHLGCVPIPNSGEWSGGFYCPCHGSHYDNAGRARRGPAPLNLEVPPYKFVTDSQILVG